MTNKQFGNYVEALFWSEATKRNLVLAQPTFDAYPYDCLVKPQGPCNDWQRIQIKGTTTCSRKIQACTSRAIKKPIESSYVDYLCAWIDADKCWFIIPTTAITSVTIRLSKASKYEPFKERWDLLTGTGLRVATA